MTQNTSTAEKIEMLAAETEDERQAYLEECHIESSQFGAGRREESE